MVKDDIIAFVGEMIVTLLNGMIEDFIHAGDIGACADYCRQILKCALQRVIKPRYDQQKQKECDHI